MDIKLNQTPTRYQQDCYYRGSWFQLIRPLTLTGTLTPILVGTGFAAKNGPVRLDIFIAFLLSALFIQATTNMLNDYFDFKNGQDQEKWMTVTNDDIPHGPPYRYIPYVVGVMLTIAISIGLWLAFASTLWIIPIGVVSIIAGIKYSAGTHSFSAIGMGETIAFLFLGMVVPTLAYLVQGNPLSMDIIAISLPFGLIIAAMILTNNIRDEKKDNNFRKTVAMMLGRTMAVKLLFSLLFLAYVSIILLIFTDVLPVTTIMVFFASPIAAKLLYSYRKRATRIEEMNGMKLAALHHWIFGLCFALGIWI